VLCKDGEAAIRLFRMMRCDIIFAEGRWRGPTKRRRQSQGADV